MILLIVHSTSPLSLLSLMPMVPARKYSAQSHKELLACNINLTAATITHFNTVLLFQGLFKLKEILQKGTEQNKTERNQTEQKHR